MNEYQKARDRSENVKAVCGRQWAEIDAAEEVEHNPTFHPTRLNSRKTGTPTKAKSSNNQMRKYRIAAQAKARAEKRRRLAA